MSDIRWCFAHDNGQIYLSAYTDGWVCVAVHRNSLCDVRDAVVLPKGEYYRITVPEQIEPYNHSDWEFIVDLIRDGSLTKVEPNA